MANKRSKRFKEAESKFNKDNDYDISEAINLLKSFPKPGFDETVEISVRLGINPKNSDQQVRTSVGLPNGTGKSVQVAVFAEGDDADFARSAGADFVGSDDLVAKVEDGWMDFDVALATPPMMRKIGKLGRFLGPRGLMPSPKNGTLCEDVESAVADFKAGKVEIRNDDGGNVHIPVGKLSFGIGKLEENIVAVFQSLQSLRPPGVGHRFLEKAVLSSTMGPGIKLKI